MSEQVQTVPTVPPEPRPTPKPGPTRKDLKDALDKILSAEEDLRDALERFDKCKEALFARRGAAYDIWLVVGPFGETRLAYLGWGTKYALTFAEKGTVQQCLSSFVSIEPAAKYHDLEWEPETDAATPVDPI